MWNEKQKLFARTSIHIHKQRERSRFIDFNNESVSYTEFFSPQMNKVNSFQFIHFHIVLCIFLGFFPLSVLRCVLLLLPWWKTNDDTANTHTHTHTSNTSKCENCQVMIVGWRRLRQHQLRHEKSVCIQTYKTDRL